jgi:predicted enzyme related to lactoylglutathione lyase
MTPTSGDAGPRHWSVDFWLDDVDAAADMAAKLGGDVVASV